jgi:hypothetical protein
MAGSELPQGTARRLKANISAANDLSTFIAQVRPE